MSTQVNIYEAKTRLSQLVDKAAEGEEVIIARNGRPVARLVPVHTPAVRRQPGSLRGKIWTTPDFDETPEEIIDMFHNGDPANPST